MPMTSTNAQTVCADSAARYQEGILPGVSRTFALTIPQLPPTLKEVVTNAYLLCRIADTIEDHVGLGMQEKRSLHNLFVAALGGRTPARVFVSAVAPLLSDDMLPAERDLMRNADRILAVTAGFDAGKRDILLRHIGIMCRGMPQFQHGLKSHGLSSLDTLNRYCYCVAGVVGEMLTELYCDYSADISRNRDELRRLAPSFGQGLQMTNILKDVWDDRERGTCWLPRDVFDACGYDLSKLAPDYRRDAFTAGIKRLIGIAHGHLRNALGYTLLIPPKERGLRRFCLWSIGLAVLTLRRIYNNPTYTSGQQVKVPRRAVKATVLVTNALTRSDRLLRVLFAWTARGLPLSGGDGDLAARAHRHAHVPQNDASRTGQVNA